MPAKFEKKVLSTLISLSLAGVAMPVYAQDEEASVEEVQVTGIRSSIRNSIAEKREETSIVEAISAEDIGKLPDVSIAESIARLPGLAAQRTRGRAQVISVRGLGPDFTTALLNGREQVTAGDNRGVEFDQYPAEILSQAVIYKTPDAALIGQAVGGTVDLRTIRPLEFGRQSINVNARYEVNDQGALNAGSNDDGYRLTASYIDQFADDTVGLSIGVATQSAPTQAERWDAWGYPNTSDGGPLVIGGAKPYVESRDLERDAVIGTLEFQPTDSLRVVADAFYSDFKDGGILRGIETPLFWSSAQLQPGFSESNGLVTNGVFDGVQGVVRNDTRAREAELTSFGLNVEYQLNEAWTLSGDLSTSKADRDDIDLETYSGTGRGGGNGASDALGFNISEGGTFRFDPQLDYADPSLIVLTDPQGWGQVGFIKRPQTDDELTSLRLEAERFVGGDVIESFEFGINQTSREKDKVSAEAFVDLAGGADSVAIPSDLLLGSTELEFLGIPGQVSYDPEALLSTGIYSLRPNTNADVLTKAWNVEEDVINLYAQVNLNTLWGDIPIRGNFGIQYVDADQESTGPDIVDGALQEFTDGDDYSDILPSLNLTFELNEATYLRFAAAKTIQRARMDDMRASREIGLDNNICAIQDGQPVLIGTHNPSDNRSCVSISGGNPRLRPYEATSFDLSVERYFEDGASNVALAIFYKDIGTWVINGSSLTDTSGQVSAIFGSDFLAANPSLGTGIYNLPVNTDGGHIQGVELSANLSGGLITPALENFGVYFSYANNDSEITPNAGEDPIDIPGFSKEIINASLYFENDNWQARVSMRDRSDFLGEVTGFGANRDFRDVNGENVIDAQFGYTFSEGALSGSSLILQAYNLTDEEFRTFLNDDPRQVKDWQRYGTSYALGFNYKF